MSHKRPGQLLLPDTRVVACRVFEPEFRALGLGPDQVIYLDQGLHRYPKDLRQSLAQEIASLEDQPAIKRVVLGYGLCGGGLEGICSRRLELVLPLAHDCIPLLLGKDTAATGVDCGGAFYLSPGWIDHGKTPFSEYHLTARKFGHEEALWAAKEMLKGYSEVVLINTAAQIKQHHRDYAQRMAELFGLAYRESEGRPDRLTNLLAACGSKQIALLAPGQLVEPVMYPHSASPNSSQGEKVGNASCTNS